MACGIYKITNTINGKCYIGSAVDLDRRKKEHFRGHRTNKVLKQAMKKYGKENFTFEVLEECTTREMLSLEQLNIDLHRVVKGWNQLYNIAPTAGSQLGTKRSEETRKKISEVQKGKKHSEESKKLMSEVKKGKQHTEEAKKLMSDAKKGKYVGNKNPMYGKQHTEETKQLMSSQRKEKYVGDNNPRYDSTIYTFQHKSGKTFQGTAYQLHTKYGLHRSNLSQMILGNRNHTGGWSVVK
jgi:group I intron endonuclease